MFENFNDSNVIREEDVENDGKNKNGSRDENEGESKNEGKDWNKNGTKNDAETNEESADGGEDIYNSSPAVFKKLSGKDFLRYFKLPLIIFVILIALLLFFVVYNRIVFHCFFHGFFRFSCKYIF